MKRCLIGMFLVALAAASLSPRAALAHRPGACTTNAYGRTYALHAGATVVTEAAGWLVASFNYQFFSSHVDDHGPAGWHNNVVIRVYDAQLSQFQYIWPSEDDKGWDVGYQHHRTVAGMPKPIAVSRHPGSYVEI